jgi:hypothetical protein
MTGLAARGELPSPEQSNQRPQDFEETVLELAGQGRLPCPVCGRPLAADRVTDYDYHEAGGVMLSCWGLDGCGFREW